MEDRGQAKEEAKVQAEELVDELTALVVDDLAPVLAWYRVRFAARLGLSVAELTCLEMCRQSGWTTSSRVAERTGLTRSAVAKLLRRLEERGHVERVIHPDEQEVEVRWRPVERRDLLWSQLREEMRQTIQEELATTHRELAARALHQLLQLSFRHARRLGDAAARARVLRERRRARAGETPWWLR